MDVIKYATFYAAAVASVTACGGGVSHDVAPTAQSAAPPVATSESASPCSSATADVLESAAQRRYGEPGNALSRPFNIYNVLCSGDWAKALIHHTRADPNTNPPGIVLFHDDGGGWRAVQLGSGFDCTDEGVPPSIATELECNG
jgi:hypothetical protein